MLNWLHSEYSVTLCGSNSTARTTDQMFNNKADPNNHFQHRAVNGAGASWKGGTSARENASVMRNAGGLITPLVAALIVVIGLLLPARAEQAIQSTNLFNAHQARQWLQDAAQLLR